MKQERDSICSETSSHDDDESTGSQAKESVTDRDTDSGIVKGMPNEAYISHPEDEFREKCRS